MSEKKLKTMGSVLTAQQYEDLSSLGHALTKSGPIGLDTDIEKGREHLTKIKHVLTEQIADYQKKRTEIVGIISDIEGELKTENPGWAPF